MHRRAVDRRLDLVTDRRDGSQVGGDRVEVAHRQYLVEGKRHLRRDRPAVPVNAVPDRALDFLIAPRPDTGLAIGRDVGALDEVGRRVPGLHPAREALFHDEAALVPRGVTAVAGHDGVDEVAAAFDRRLGKDAAGGRDQRGARNHKSDHVSPWTPA